MMLIKHLGKLSRWNSVCMCARRQSYLDVLINNATCRQYNKGSSDPDPVKAMGYRCEWSHSYTAWDAITYALGIGVSTTESNHMKFLFEKDDNFCVMPSYGLISAQKEVLASTLEGRLPGLANIDPAKVLHGEQYMEVLQPLPQAATLRNELVVVDVMDKRSGALLLFDVHTSDSKGELILYNQFSIFIVGAGGFGGKKGSDHEKSAKRPPTRPVEFSISQATSVDQAALYRLSGDYNPLHIDQTVAARVGFSRPVLHGLCTLGFGLRHVLQTYAKNDVAKFKAVKVRFSKPVFPGQTIKTSMWRDGHRVYFQCEVTETNDIVISGAYVDFHHID